VAAASAGTPVYEGAEERSGCAARDSWDAVRLGLGLRPIDVAGNRLSRLLAMPSSKSLFVYSGGGTRPSLAGSVALQRRGRD
jgi:hypothetical protein